MKFEDVKKNLRNHLKNRHVHKISIYFEKIVGSVRQCGSIILRINKGTIERTESSGYSFPLIRPEAGEMLPEDDFHLTEDDDVAFIKCAQTIFFA